MYIRFNHVRVRSSLSVHHNDYDDLWTLCTYFRTFTDLSTIETYLLLYLLTYLLYGWYDVISLLRYEVVWRCEMRFGVKRCDEAWCATERWTLTGGTVSCLAKSSEPGLCLSNYYTTVEIATTQVSYEAKQRNPSRGQIKRLNWSTNPYTAHTFE